MIEAAVPDLGREDLKEQALFATLAAWPALIVAYSGGVDSAYLAWAATRVLGRQALCITADSPSYPERHRSFARQIASEFRFEHEIIHTNEMERPRVPRQSRQPVLFLQARALHASLRDRPRARNSHDRRRKQRR